MQAVWDPSRLRSDGARNVTWAETAGLGVSDLPGPLENRGKDPIVPSDMWDAVKWENLQGKAGAKAGYIDGPVSEWPAEAWAAFGGDPLLRITVLASEEGEAFDGETGNAGPEAVASAIANRISDGKWCLLYANETQMGDYLRALASKSLKPSDRSSWPAAGFYLWPADPSGNIAAGKWQLPVEPAAVQDEWSEGFDHSALYVELTAPPPSPAPAPAPPAPPQEVIVEVQVPQVSQGSQGGAVVAVQKLVGGLADDGIFGPLTHNAVVGYQQSHGLSPDGVVGVHTWGSLLGHPQ